MATLKESIAMAQRGELSKEDSEKLKQFILSGKMDSIAEKEGIDLSAFKEKFGVSASIQTTGQSAASTLLESGMIGDLKEKADPTYQKPSIFGALPEKIEEEGFVKGVVSGGLENIKTGIEATGLPDILRGAKETIGQGVDSVKQSFADDQFTGVAERAILEKFGVDAPEEASTTYLLSGANDILSGSIRAVLSPIEAIAQKTPIVNTLVEKFSEGVDSVSGFIGDQLGSTEMEKDAIKKTFNNIFMLGSMKYGPKATTSAVETIGSVSNWAGKGLKNIGRSTAEKVLPTTTKEAELMQSFEARKMNLQEDLKAATDKATKAKLKDEISALKRPRTVGETAVERGVSGTQTRLGLEAEKAGSKIFEKEINPALKASNEKITKDDLFGPLEEKIKNTAEPGRKSDLRDALEAIKEEYKDILEFDLETAQKIKQGLDEFTPQKAFQGKEIGSAYNQLRADMANAIRRLTYDKLKDIKIKNKYLDYMNLLELEKLGIKARTQKGLAFKPGGTQTFIRDLWDMAAIPIGTSAGKYLYKIGEFLEFESPMQIKTVGEYIESIGLTKDEFLSVFPIAVSSELASEDQ